MGAATAGSEAPISAQNAPQTESGHDGLGSFLGTVAPEMLPSSGYQQGEFSRIT